MKIKFFDEAGIKSPDAGIRLYGHAPGAGCIKLLITFLITVL